MDLSKYVKVREGTAVIAVAGRFDLCSIPILESELLTAFTNGCTKVEVDFAETTFIESASVGLLMKVKKRVGDGNIVIKNLKGAVLRSFKEMDLLNNFRDAQAN